MTDPSVNLCDSHVLKTFEESNDEEADLAPDCFETWRNTR